MDPVALGPPPAAPPSPGAAPAETARDFEAMMLGEMVEDLLSTAMPETGSHGATIWRGFLARALADELADAGTLGIAPTIEGAIERYAAPAARGDGT